MFLIYKTNGQAFHEFNQPQTHTHMHTPKISTLIAKSEQPGEKAECMWLPDSKCIIHSKAQKSSSRRINSDSTTGPFKNNCSASCEFCLVALLTIYGRTLELADSKFNRSAQAANSRSKSIWKKEQRKNTCQGLVTLNHCQSTSRQPCS
jgi:hypothetical protein